MHAPRTVMMQVHDFVLLREDCSHISCTGNSGIEMQLYTLLNVGICYEKETKYSQVWDTQLTVEGTGMHGAYSV